MDEVLELQQQLAAAQRSSTAQRLSDRNVVELVMKLQALKLVDLIFTRTGKQYLTHPQLKLEIEDELLARGGRVNVLDLPDALNVDLHHIQSKLPEVVRPDNSVRLVRGELVTDYYLASIAEEVDDNLTSSENGLDDVGAIATRYSLPVDIVKETIITHRNTISATFDSASGTLRSAASIARADAAARGALRAVATPSVLADIASQRNVQLTLVKKAAEEMLQSGELRGVLEGSMNRATFIPDVFSIAAVNAVTAAFASNGFVALARLRKMHLPDITRFAEENLEDGEVLSECVVGPVLVETLRTSAAEALDHGGWLDVTGGLPPDFPEADVVQVVERIAAKLPVSEASGTSKVDEGKTGKTRRKARNASKRQAGAKETIVFGDRFIASPQLIKSVTDLVVNDATKRADRRAKAMAENMEMIDSRTEVVSTDVADTTANEGGKKTKGKGRRRAGGKGNDSGKGTATRNSVGESNFPITVPSSEELIEIILADDACARAIESDYLEASGDGEEMLSHILEVQYGDNGLREHYQSKAAEAVVILERERAQAKQAAEKALLEGLLQVQLYYGAAESLPVEELVEASKEWVIDSMCVNSLCRIVDEVAKNTGVSHLGSQMWENLPSKKEKVDFLRETCGKLPPTIEAKIRSFMSVVGDKDPGTADDFLTLYDESVTLLDLPERRPLDNKGEKSAFANIRAQLTRSLDDKESLSESRALQVAAVLVHAKTARGTVVAIPPEHLMGFCVAIEESAKPAEAGAALKELREYVAKRSETAEGWNTDSPFSSEFGEKLKVLREYIG